MPSAVWNAWPARERARHQVERLGELLLERAACRCVALDASGTGTAARKPSAGADRQRPPAARRAASATSRADAARARARSARSRWASSCTPDCSISVASAEPRAVPADAAGRSPGSGPSCCALTQPSLPSLGLVVGRRRDLAAGARSSWRCASIAGQLRDADVAAERPTPTTNEERRGSRAAITAPPSRLRTCRPAGGCRTAFSRSQHLRADAGRAEAADDLAVLASRPASRTRRSPAW